MKYELDNSLYIAEGDKRKVYKHPYDSNKIIKIDKIPNDDYLLESKYIEYLKNNNIQIPKYFVQCEQIIDTNLGKGYVYPFIKGTTLRKINKLNEKTYNNLLNIIDDIYNNNYLMYCLCPDNIIIDDIYIYIIDGIGAYSKDIDFLNNNKDILNKKINKIKRYINIFKYKRA